MRKPVGIVGDDLLFSYIGILKKIMSAIFFFLPAFNTIILSMFCNVYLIYTCLKSAKPKSTQQSSPSQINPASAKTKKTYKFHQQTNDKLTPLLALWNNPLFSMFEKLQDTSPTPTKATIKGHPALMKKKKHEILATIAIILYCLKFVGNYYRLT